ncbi:UDP-sugar transporter UST74c-like [Rhopalosiphum maidis]|uniref:UDP-sugar transporter UST74c-like n=1 Tax=Rhopalosiphum maidis TaxID=43146 RepID=UPI000EFE48D9|nr:UDP-sugar transporter UST74c-like [Rhopalosiphum maidis]XP_026810461.1 UDP-sugar transporter UST74c-like [Rhopalosiphum maidis]XP_026810462.1 UDP-sugar transporter UST74c-like [Rhopalosiphum maidis]
MIKMQTRPPRFAKAGTALLYAAASTLITIVNKSVLTGYGFPSYRFLAVSQMLATVTVLYAAKRLGRARFPDIGGRTFADVFPMPLIHLGNVELGLAGTKELSLPTFTVLRRLAIPMTMSGEYYLLRVAADPFVKTSVAMMVAGAVIAAGSDVELNIDGCAFVLFNNLLTAANGVFSKRKLNANRQMGKCGLLYYSSLFVLPFALAHLYFSDDLDHVYRFNYWLHPSFLIQMFVSSIMGLVLNYSTMLCIQYNSALTTTIIGCLKNIIVTYAGMFVGGDYVYTFYNFIGINISIIGSLYYTYVTFRLPKQMKYNIK